MRNSTLCYIERGGKWLMMHRVKKKNDINHDKWIGVGGGFEEGESPEECVCREVIEETGLVLGRIKYRGIVTFVAKPSQADSQTALKTEYMHLFTSDDFSGDIPSADSCDEGQLEWVDKQKVYSLPIWEGDKLFLHKLEQDCPFFSMKLVYRGDELVEAVVDQVRIV
ncbi:MAG: NUDIX domain-containing protein [Eubacteriales bacterium]|nr:NUDIX domain-containing protein [Eubacteriales bacterium]